MVLALARACGAGASPTVRASASRAVVTRHMPRCSARMISRACMVCGLLCGCAKIGGDDIGIAAHFLGRALGELLAIVEDENMVGQVHHELHVVLDQNYGDAGFGHLLD